MPAKSMAQQQFMAMCLKYPGKTKGKCPGMDKEDIAETKQKGLKNRLGRKLKK